MKTVQIFAIAVSILFVVGHGVSKFVEQYRIDQNSLYANGKLISLLIVGGSIILSIVNSILLIRDLKIEIGKKIFWFALSLFPILVVIVCTIINAC